MKKFLALLLSLALALSLAACGGQPDAAGSGAPSDEAPPAAESAGPAKTEAEPSEKPSKAPKPAEPGELPEMFPLQASIEETVLVDEKGVKITATGLSYTGYSAELALTLENNSDQDLSFRTGTNSCNCNSVNGYMLDGLYFNTDVPAGKKASETLDISQSDLLILGITDIADIELSFQALDDDYDSYLETGPIRLETSIAGSYDYEADTYQAAISSSALAAALDYSLDCFAVDELYSEQGVRIVSEALLTNQGGDQTVLVEVENDSGQQVHLTTGQFCLNGLQVMSGAGTIDDIGAGKRRVLLMPVNSMLDDAYRPLFGLTSVGEVTFSVNLKDAGGVDLCGDRDVTFAIPGVTPSYSDAGDLVYSGNSVRLITKGIVPDSSSYSDDIHILFLAENGTPGEISVDVDYNSLSVNGYMTGFFNYSRTVRPGGSCVLDVELRGSSLEENGIADVADITEVEFTLEIKDSDYDTIAEPTVTIGEGAQPVVEEDAPSAAPGVTPEFKELMDSYEAFFSEYAAFMTSYQESGDSISLLADYLSFMSKYGEMMEKLNAIDTGSLSAADAAYYAETMARISAQMAEAGE